jgi:hypothetical protein
MGGLYFKPKTLKFGKVISATWDKTDNVTGSRLNKSLKRKKCQK